MCNFDIIFPLRSYVQRWGSLNYPCLWREFVVNSNLSRAKVFISLYLLFYNQIIFQKSEAKRARGACFTSFLYDLTLLHVMLKIKKNLLLFSRVAGNVYFSLGPSRRGAFLNLYKFLGFSGFSGFSTFSVPLTLRWHYRSWLWEGPQLLVAIVKDADGQDWYILIFFFLIWYLFDVTVSKISFRFFRTYDINLWQENMGFPGD